MPKLTDTIRAPEVWLQNYQSGVSRWQCSQKPYNEPQSSENREITVNREWWGKIKKEHY